MTNLEALQSKYGVNYPINPNLYLTAFIDVTATFPTLIDVLALNPGDVYVSANVKTVDLCVAGLLIYLISSPDISEGGYKVTLADRNAIIAAINGIYAKYNLPLFTQGPVVSDISNLW